MTIRSAGIVMTPIESDEAQGVRIRRTIGSDKLVLLDPFLLLDHMSVAGGGDAKEIGFPLHPHRGIETLTYVMAGRVHHRDSLGNDDSIGPGESQWMTAGGGIFHSEMVEVTGPEGHEGLQIWLNMPAAEKMRSPTYRAARTADIGVVEKGGSIVRVIAGTFEGVTGPFAGILAEPLYLDVRLAAGDSITIPTPAGYTAFAYTYLGTSKFGEAGTAAEPANLVIFTDGDAVKAVAGDTETRFLLVAAKPMREPVLQYRSLVMSTVEEMQQALTDLENGTFAKDAVKTA
jgi:quercetin 2,3-dioxygenase